MAEGVTFPSPETLLRASPAATVPAPESKKPKFVRRQSKAKKAALRKTLPADASSGKPKQSKSRNGCVTCKAKRLKCDEEKPGCQQCAKRKVECGGYKKDFKWRTFEESIIKQNYDRQKNVSLMEDPAPALEATSQTLSSRTKTKRPSKQPSRPSPSRSTSLEQEIQHDENVTSEQAQEKRWSLLQDSAQSSPTEAVSPDTVSPRFDRNVSNSSYTPIASYQELFMLSDNGASPTMIAQLPLEEPAFSNSIDQDFVNFSMPEDMHRPSWLAPSDDPLNIHGPMILADESIEDENSKLMNCDIDPDLMQLSTDSALSLTSTFGSPSLSFMDALDQLSPPLLSPQAMPLFAPDSLEMITARFDRMTCGILSVMDGPSENPWRTLIWPLASQSQALYHAIISMTAFHGSAEVPSLRLKGHLHKQLSVKYILEGISENTIGKQTAIATALALGFSESWDRHTDTGNTHIKGAQALVRAALEEHNRNPLTGEDLARLKFLINAWVYMDVIARLTAFTSDESTDFDNTFLFSRDSPRTVLGSDSPDDKAFGIDFGMPMDARLDPLMGCAGSLFPLIGRVANLVRRVCRSRSNSPAIVEAAQKLQEQLQKWSPPRYIDRPEDPTTDPQHTVQTAEAYRFATLLHLHQSVPELPSPSSEDLARQVMNCLATVPIKSRTVIVQIFPLMVAGCVAAAAEDRAWVRKRWHDMSVRMQIGVVDKSLQVTEEVWRRRDAYEAAAPGQFRLFPTAELVSTSFRPQRHERRPAHMLYDDTPPGNVGMVFSLVGADDEFSASQQMATGGQMGRVVRAPNAHIQDCIRGPMDVAYTPRGHAHWCGVMWDWGWEVLLG